MAREKLATADETEANAIPLANGDPDLSISEGVENWE